MDNSQDKMIVVYTTFPTDQDARRTGRFLVEEGLVACVNIFPKITAIYEWEGAVAEETECGAFLKSRSGKIDALMKRLKSLHPYDVPAIFTLEPGQVDGDYNNWLSTVLS